MAALNLTLMAWLTAPHLKEPFIDLFGESQVLNYDWGQGWVQSQRSLHWLADSCSQKYIELSGYQTRKCYLFNFLSLISGLG